ncbi:Uncharacterised protein [Klebsiella quasipneumoniae]|uniref:hypothetical protein n=1 Tax=Klebsiella quasipneumoniae TaxID=1463165 RepID=UPI0010E08FBB|nr:hypothetical protein [Klebsiella quasipneumoniae]VGG57444.1 Uncharacterised protein [Klebsiella quasipneumoniae]
MRLKALMLVMVSGCRAGEAQTPEKLGPLYLLYVRVHFLMEKSGMTPRLQLMIIGK